MAWCKHRTDEVALACKSVNFGYISKLRELRASGAERSIPILVCRRGTDLEGGRDSVRHPVQNRAQKCGNRTYFRRFRVCHIETRPSVPPTPASFHPAVTKSR